MRAMAGHQEEAECYEGGCAQLTLPNCSEKGAGIASQVQPKKQGGKTFFKPVTKLVTE